MSSFFTWLDYSEHEKRQMLDCIDLFREQDTRDELGIGTVRDAFADLLFPGTSTIQRRARYFLFVPWVYLDLERRKVASSKVTELARRKEVALIDILVESDDSEGTIGRRARKTLKRLPSNVYWQGLGVWGIRLFPGSQEQYHRSLDSFYELLIKRDLQSKEDSSDERLARNWHAGLPPAPDDFPKDISFKLTQIEGEYLRERIMVRLPRSLLAFLVDRGQIYKPVIFPWLHHQLDEFSEKVLLELEHARNFSESIHGASLLYNLMLAEQSNSKEREEGYRDELQQWAVSIEERHDVLSEWDRNYFWEVISSVGAKVPPLTRTFIDNWLNLILGSKIGHIRKNNKARELIHRREGQLKRGLARLDNRRALELWTGAAGTAQLDYRWHIAQTIITDILNATLPKGKAHNARTK